MLAIRERIVGNLSRLAISTAKREITTVCNKLKEYPLELVAKDAPEKIAIAYLTEAIEQVKQRRPRL
jgi:hypothetical protein